MMEAIPEYEKGGLKEKVSPLDSLVKKFERQGYTVEQAFYLFCLLYTSDAADE